MLNKVLISIIIPVYNVEKYIIRCLDSIINQPFKDIEIILVDDGSKDISGDICDSYSQKDKRITVIHKKNGGVSSARNAGISIATGDWVLFIDGDDVLEKDALNLYAKTVTSKDVDMVLGNYVECDEQGNITLSDNQQFEGYKDMLECLKLFYRSDTCLFQGYIWNRLMKRSIIIDNNLLFDESIHYKEDGLFAVQYMICCSNKCWYTSKIVYRYYQHPTSSIHTYNTSFSDKYLSNLNARILCLNSINKKYNNKKLIHYAKASIVYFYFEIKYKLNKLEIDNKNLKNILFQKVIASAGLWEYLRFYLATIKGYIYSNIKFF